MCHSGFHDGIITGVADENPVRPKRYGPCEPACLVHKAP